MGRLFPRSTGPSDARSQEDEQQRAEELYAFAAVQARAGLPIACNDDDPDFLMPVDGHHARRRSNRLPSRPGGIRAGEDSSAAI